MAAEWKVGTFTGHNSATAQTVSITETWTPVCVIIWGIRLTTLPDDSTTGTLVIGAATGSSNQFGMGVPSENAATTMDTRRAFQTDQIISASSSTTDSVAVEAAFTSFGAGEFTITWANANSNAWGYMAFGEQSAAVGVIDVQASTGRQSITSLSFPPKAVLFMNTIDNTTEGVVAGNAGCIGVGVSSSQRWALAWHDDDNVDPSVADTYLHTTACIARVDGAGLTVDCDYVGPLVNGFTIDVQDAPASTMRVGYIALGGDITVGAATFGGGAALGNESETPFSFTPQALIFAGDVSAVDDLRPNQHTNFGAVSAATEEFGTSMISLDAAGTSAAGRSHTNVHGLVRATSDGTSTTIRGNVVSLDSGGWTTDWDATPGERFWGVLGIKAGGEVGANPHPPLLGVSRPWP